MKESEPFSEILNYMKSIERDFNIEICEYNSSGIINEEFMKKSLSSFVTENKINHIILGTRSTDPFTQGLSLFSPSDSVKGWPVFQRVLPIYDWTYNDIWTFIIANELPYCELYSKGFTYVGDQTNTIPNPFLKGLHARFANDNIELFSRKKLCDKLPKENGKIIFDKENTLLFFKPTVNLLDFDIKTIEKDIADFCNLHDFVFKGNISEIEKIDATEGMNFGQTVLMKKRIPGNFGKMYLGITIKKNGLGAVVNF